ncbi:MAG: NAD(+) diphosphatase [Paracoccaceae bacterium]
MKIAETVTFGGGGLDRAAHRRGDAAGIARLLQDGNALAILYWRGKFLYSGTNETKIARLPVVDALICYATAAPFFMGIIDTAPIFAYDISDWQPDDLPETDAGIFDNSQIRHPDLPDDFRFGNLRGAMAHLSPLDAELAASAKALFSWHDSHRFCAKCGEPSVQSMAGWQRQCPACHSLHFPRTDPVVIMLITNGNRVLLGRSPDWPKGMFSLLAGFIEPGETLEAAVRREVMEEAGISVGPVRYLASQPWPFPASLMIGCSGEAIETEINIDSEELEEAFWLSREALMEVFAGNNPDILPARRGSIGQFLLQNWLADRLD